MDICFVLVAPAVAENVGFSARALKTMGFSGLRLVQCTVHEKEEALWTAHGAKDILETVKVFDTLEEALADRDFTVATTARRRGMKHEYYTPQELIPLIRGKGDELRAAVVFGCEESGLSNHDLGLCDCISSVPLAAAYPSLNLAQAVMVYAYALSPLAGRLASPDGKYTWTAPPVEKQAKQTISDEEDLTFQALKRRASLLLEKLYTAENLLSRRILERLGALNKADIKLAHSLCEKLEKMLKKLTK